MSDGDATGAEQRRLAEADAGVPWRRWGPYLSERQWGTVREDYSADGDAWYYFPHDHARSRAYRWGEDGIAGICDDQQRLCLALALWNGRDPILKERLFGLTNPEGNHGEDVKEYYFYLDSDADALLHEVCSTSTRSAAFPYADLVADEPRGAASDDPEYELLDTGVFDDGPLLRRRRRVRQGRARGPADADHRARTAAPRRRRCTCCRRCGSATPGPGAGRRPPRPSLRADAPRRRRRARSPPSTPSSADRLAVRRRAASCCSPRTRPTPSGSSAPPNADAVRQGRHRRATSSTATRGAVNPARAGTKAAAHYALDVPAGGSAAVRLRLTRRGEPRRRRLRRRRSTPTSTPLIDARRREADEFYADVIAPAARRGRARR